MASDDWSKRFDDAITTPDGTVLRTLQDAVRYLAKVVPKAEMNHPKVMTAAQMLTYAAERGPAWMFMAYGATLQAIYRNKERVFNSDRKDHHWGKRRLKRDQ